MYLCGIDGGGSKTLCLIADEKGNIIGLGKAGPSNISEVGLDGLIRTIVQSIKSALRGDLKRLDFLCVSLAGVGGRNRWDTVYDLLKKCDLAIKLTLVPDIYAVLYSATLNGNGIVVISGTGSIVAGIINGKLRHRAGGWGYLVDDEGSAFHIGREAIRRALRIYDGRDRGDTRLVNVILNHFGVNDLNDLVDLIALGRIKVKDIASLAPHIINISNDNLTAREIVKKACKELVKGVMAVYEKMNMDLPIILGGSLLLKSKRFRDLFIDMLKRKVPSVQIVVPKFEPVVGALIMAYLQAGINIGSGQLMINLEEQIAKEYRNLYISGELHE